MIDVGDRRLVRIGWIAAAVVALVGGIATVLVFVPTRPGVAYPSAIPVLITLTALLLGAPTLLGLVIIRALPRSPIGWLLMAFPVLFALPALADGLGRHLQPSPAVAWLVTLGTSWPATVGVAALFLVLFLFPGGRLLSPRWRWGPLLLALSTLFTATSAILAPYPVPDLADLPNPIGQPALNESLRLLNGVGGLGMSAALLLAIAQLAIRFRRTRGIERQQTKWFFLAASVVAALAVVGGTLEIAGVQETPEAEALIGIAWWSSVLLLPASVTVAVLRYRLYDIDRIISRTVAYAAVSAVLAGTFAATILALQGVLAPLTGDDTLAVAGSTLLVAALFQPLRRRVQSVADRRFNRSRYDAQRTIDRFSERLRDEVDIETVRVEVLATVDATMQPRGAAIWLRGARG